MPWASALLGGLLILPGFAPFSVPVLPIAGLALLYWAVRDARPGRAFLLGWLHALAFAIPGMLWVRRLGDNMNTTGHAEAIGIALLVIAGLVALHGLAMAVFVLLRRGAGYMAPLLFAALWFLAELLRGQPAIGIPAWLSVGYGQIDLPIAGWAPVVGVHGVSFLAVLSAALTIANRGRRYGWIAAALIWGAGFGLQQIDWTTESGPHVPVALVQRGTPQDIREPEDRERHLAQLDELHARAAHHAELVVWGESSLNDTSVSRLTAPFLAALDKDLSARGKHLLFTLTQADASREEARNTLVALGGPESQYAKRILAPFGEYLPRGRWIDPVWQALGLYYNSWLVPGDSARPLMQVGSQAVGVAICYEIAFGEPLRAALPDAAFLVTVANDSWFEGTLEPAQHLEIARMRALETGRWLLRAALSGQTAIVSPGGEVVGRLTPGIADVLEGEIVPRAGMTPYARWGDWPLLLLCGMAVALAAGQRLQRRHFGPNPQ